MVDRRAWIAEEVRLCMPISGLACTRSGARAFASPERSRSEDSPAGEIANALGSGYPPEARWGARRLRWPERRGNMRKRTLLVAALCCGAEAIHAQSDAQRPRKVHRIGYISAAADLEHFQEAMRKLGYVEGVNTVLVVRMARGRLDLLPSMAADIVGLQVEV